VRSPEELVDDAHLHDQEFWKQVEHPELGCNFGYPGEATIYNGSPWRIARRAPLIGEHNQDIRCGEFGLSLPKLAMLAESQVI
jgi:crotonobetainyl-CoA:carnitine CoA-transferase CaiB-like acyl-CoA transferase